VEKLSGKDFEGCTRWKFAGSALFAMLVAFAFCVFPAYVQADDLAALQTSVISTDLFLGWLPAQKSDLKLSSEQVSALRSVQGDFKGKSEEIGRRIQRNAVILSDEVSKYPIDLKRIKPAIEEISQLRGDLTYSAIKSLFRVQSILKQSQWDQAKSEWGHILASKAVAPASSASSVKAGH